LLAAVSVQALSSSLLSVDFFWFND
jgi:hypothetical protein